MTDRHDRQTEKQIDKVMTLEISERKQTSQNEEPRSSMSSSTKQERNVYMSDRNVSMYGICLRTRESKNYPDMSN